VTSRARVMMHISGFSALTRIHVGARSSIHRARRVAPMQLILLFSSGSVL
jgi:hypothetical protein